MSDENDVSASGGDRTATEVRRAVRGVLPDAELREASAVERGKNAVYDVTLRDGRKLVLKVGDHHSAVGCRAEPVVLERVAARTEIPVPTVVGTGELDGSPYFLAERVAGESDGPEARRPPPVTLERVCFEAGRNLGELHAAFPADDWGLLGVREGGDDLEFVREFPDWPTYYEAWVTHNAERLDGTRFAGLIPEVKAAAAEASDELREYGPFDPVVVHNDYRLENLVLSPDWTPDEAVTSARSAVTNAVLDWAVPTAATAEYELATTEAILADRLASDEGPTRRLRERLYEGYERANDLERGEAFDARRRLYRLGTRLRLMVHLREEAAGRPDVTVDARAREHRTALEAYGID